MRGLNAAQALNKTYQRRPARCAAARSSTRRSPAPNTARPLEADREHRQGHLRAERPRAGARRTDRQLQHLLRGLRGAVDGAQRDRRRTARDARATSTAGLAALDASFAPTQTFAHDIIPGVKPTPATVTAALPWIEQVQASLAPNELGGVAKGLADGRAPRSPSSRPNRSPFYQQTELFNKCLTNVIYPGRQHQAPGRLRDARASKTTRSSGTAWSGLSGHRPELRRQRHAARSSWSATAARRCVREPTSILGSDRPGQPQLLARSPLHAARHAPGLPRRRAAYQPLVPCYTQALPELQRPALAGPRGRERRDGHRAAARRRTRAGSASATRSSATARRSSRS